MDYIDKWFMDSDVAPENKELYVQLKEVARPYIDKWMADPLADHRALHAEMKVAVLTFLKKHNPESVDQINRVVDRLNRL